MQIIENTVRGILGTLVGLGLGWIVLTQSMGVRVEEQLAEKNFLMIITPESLVLIGAFHFRANQEARGSSHLVKKIAEESRLICSPQFPNTGIYALSF